MIDDDDAGRVAQGRPRPILGERPFKLDINRLGMTDEHRHAYAGRADRDIGIENFAGLDRHFPFFLGRAVIHEDINVRDHVERDLLGQLLRLDRVVDVDRPGLIEQLVHRGATGARDRLVGGDHDPFDAGQIVQWLQRHDHLDRRAVRVGDDAALAVMRDRLRIDLGHDQRHVRLHPEAGGVVDDNRTGLGRTRREDRRHLAAGR